MMEELEFVLGFHIKKIVDGIMILQQKYLRDLLKKYGMHNCIAYDKPIPTSTKLDAWRYGEKDVEALLYRDMIGYLLYLIASNLILFLV